MYYGRFGRWWFLYNKMRNLTLGWVYIYVIETPHVWKRGHHTMTKYLIIYDWKMEFPLCKIANATKKQFKETCKQNKDCKENDNNLVTCLWEVEAVLLITGSKGVIIQWDITWKVTHGCLPTLIHHWPFFRVETSSSVTCCLHCVGKMKGMIC